MNTDTPKLRELLCFTRLYSTNWKTIGELLGVGDVADAGDMVGIGHFLTLGIVSLIILLVQVNIKDPHFVYNTLEMQMHIYMYFSLFFNDQLLKQIVNQTNL